MQLVSPCLYNPAWLYWYIVFLAAILGGSAEHLSIQTLVGIPVRINQMECLRIQAVAGPAGSLLQRLWTTCAGDWHWHIALDIRTCSIVLTHGEKFPSASAILYNLVLETG